MRRRGGLRAAAWCGCGAACLAFVVAAAFVGGRGIGPGVLLRPEGTDPASVIFWKLRLPRTLQAFCAGCGLAASGMAFQALFRNPLATPFTLGVASGASLGASLFVRLGLVFTLIGISSLTLGAFLGALSAVGIVWGLSQRREGLSTSLLLLAGVAVSFFFSSVILFLQYTADPYSSFRILRLIIGGIQERVGFSGARAVVPFVVVGTAALAFLTRELNLLSIGEDIAASRGVAVERTKKLLFCAASLMVAGVVSVTGPIGFVGMMAPHICRLLVGADHRALLPATCLFGGAFLCLCDTVARTCMSPAQLPVGVITAFLGGPFFLWLLLTRSPERLSF